MILIGTATGIVRRVRYRRTETLCGYLGCGDVATRLAYDRLYNRVRACADPRHGKEIPKC
jgi:hypothetical protein